MYGLAFSLVFLYSLKLSSYNLVPSDTREPGHESTQMR